MQLLDNAQAFKLLDGANLSEDDCKLVLALANDIKLQTMQSALKRLFSLNRDRDGDSSNLLLNKKKRFICRKEVLVKVTIKRKQI